MEEVEEEVEVEEEIEEEVEVPISQEEYDAAMRAAKGSSHIFSYNFGISDV